MSVLFYPKTQQRALSTYAFYYLQDLQYFWCLYQLDSITGTTARECYLQGTGGECISAHGYSVRRRLIEQIYIQTADSITLKLL